MGTCESICGGELKPTPEIETKHRIVVQSSLVPEQTIEIQDIQQYKDPLTCDDNPKTVANLPQYEEEAGNKNEDSPEIND